MKRALVISAILTVLVGIAFLAVTMGGGTVRGQEDSTPTPAPECLVPADLDVVIVIDKTGSMLQETGGKTRLQWAKAGRAGTRRRNGRRLLQPQPQPPPR